MNENQPLFFLKFGNKENMTDLLENGTVYFNTINYFQTLEEKCLRGDKYEGSTRIHNYHEYDNVKVTITIPETGKTIPINPTKLHVHEFLKDIKGNLYSLYCIRPKDLWDIENYRIDPRVKKFGSHFVIIQDTGKFLDHVFSELANQDFEAGSVEYYNKDKINSEITPFQKPDQYIYQSEYRIVWFNNESIAKPINIGSIKEYAQIFEVDAIDTLKISVKA